MNWWKWLVWLAVLAVVAGGLSAVIPTAPQWLDVVVGLAVARVVEGLAFPEVTAVAHR